MGPELRQFPECYKSYSWSDKHALFGYAADKYPDFQWIRSLERRFKRYRLERGDAPLYLVREMIQWGGSQNGVLEKFDNALGSYCLKEVLTAVLGNIEKPKSAIEEALKIPGFGLTYASKLLRFLQPEKYGALDGRIRKVLTPPLPKICDGNTGSMTSGYCAFVNLLREYRESLTTGHVMCPSEEGIQRSWSVAEIEMALFAWATFKSP